MQTIPPFKKKTQIAVSDPKFFLKYIHCWLRRRKKPNQLLLSQMKSPPASNNKAEKES